ncbi:MAG: thioredoxin domain-containing protein [SAR324 cluster bacterium]|uniref:Thioredoxin domain-containing protein n=1 Tax=SAR324 cluster bacterium TaxID=2024889 RepID=A0A432GJU0_9DELT|nr:MAG: thioredoxin domain-containing protein [SAR324 cluster bacterium]
MPEHSFTNKLINEKSPYLLQHAHNPVNWYPWGQEAFEKAKSEDKLLLVSIGYATCHWCHVMERESFEDPELALYLNKHFVPVKVDREERPDVDKIHMDALHALGQQGGWPLNMFLTPEGKPVTGGTYFPPKPMYGRKSFRELLENLVFIWENEREKIYSTADEITSHLQQQAVPSYNGLPELNWEVEEKAVAQFRESFDSRHGGFNQQLQNKFPPSMGLMLLLRHYDRTGNAMSLEMVEKTLQKMFAGGIYDQLGGGLSRYSTDYEWLVPHFEKMLYDNSLFIWALIETFQVTKDPLYETAVRDVLTYVARDMTSPQGAFFSAEDADSEGVEGKFYLWSKAEVTEILGAETGKLACAYWDITEKGNFESSNIPNRPMSDEEVAEQFSITTEEMQVQLRAAREKLLAVRSQRIRPLLDDKVLTSWNALMISAFARAARVFDDTDFEMRAVRAADFIFENLRDESGRLLRRWRDGEARYPAYLCDHAQLAAACLDLYETTYDPEWFRKAVELSQGINRLFRNDDGPYYDTGIDGETLLTRNAEGYDGVEPSGNSSVTNAFLRLRSYGLSPEFYSDAQRILRSFAPHLNQAGVSFSAMLGALHFSLSEPKEIIISGRRGDPETEALLKEVRSEFHPNIVVAFVENGESPETEKIIPLASGRVMVNERATAYVCQNQICQLPVHSIKELRKLLN